MARLGAESPLRRPPLSTREIHGAVLSIPIGPLSQTGPCTRAQLTVLIAEVEEAPTLASVFAHEITKQMNLLPLPGARGRPILISGGVAAVVGITAASGTA
eukprot:104892-Pyramimonas_sp.AAC.1